MFDRVSGPSVTSTNQLTVSQERGFESNHLVFLKARPHAAHYGTVVVAGTLLGIPHAKILVTYYLCLNGGSTRFINTTYSIIIKPSYSIKPQALQTANI